MMSKRTILIATLASLTLLEAGCSVGTRRPSRRAAPGSQPPPPMGTQPVQLPTERYSPAPPQQIGRLPLFLPGTTRQQLVAFQVVDGMAVYEGDIMLGPAGSLVRRYGLPKIATPNVKHAVAVSDDSYLWPNGDIPYVIGASVPQDKRDYISWAVAQANQTELNLHPRMGTERDYVTFDGAGHGCTSYVGRIGGSQEIQVAGCGRGSVLHEILHCAGFYHEQSRADRDDYVTIMFDEIDPSQRSNFEKSGPRSQDIGPYDYGSIMHYSSRAFSRTGNPTIIPKDPNAKIGQREGLSVLDKAAISKLYGNGSAMPPPTVPPPGTQPPGTQPPGPRPPGTQPPGPCATGSFAGTYTSSRGEVVCTQNAVTVSCSYPGGSLLCGVRGGNALDCGWSGGGQGRATFTRQTDGTLAGTWGDFLSNTSRGRWDLVPARSVPAPGTTTPGTPPPGTTTPPGGQPAAISLSGSYASTRGPMSCTESGSSLTCDFQEGSAAGRLSCAKDTTGLHLSCRWATFFPVPGLGRAVFSRTSRSDRNLTGTWGRLNSATDGGTWNAQGQ